MLVPHVAVRSDIPPPPPTTVRPGRRPQRGTQVAAAAAGALVVALIALVALAGKSEKPSASRVTDVASAAAYAPAPKATASSTWRVSTSEPATSEATPDTSAQEAAAPATSSSSTSYAGGWAPPPRATTAPRVTSAPRDEPAKKALGSSCSAHDECGSGRCGANECVSVTVYSRMQRCNQGTNTCFQRSTGIAACVDDAQASAGCYGGCNAARCQ